MGFDLKKFERTKFEPREGKVKVPGLAHPEFFDGNKKDAVWKVRGLTHSELAQVNEESRSEASEVLITALSRSSKAEKADALRELLGVESGTPEDTRRCIQMIIRGTIEPEGLQEHHAAKLADAFPIEFVNIVKEITRLTGLGKVPDMGKSKGSGKTQTSNAPLRSASG